MWYLLEENNSWSKVHEKNILQAGTEIKKGDRVKFWYHGMEYEGVVLEKNRDHDVINEEMNKLKKQTSSKRPSSKEEDPLPAKRKINPVAFYGNRTNSKGAASTSGQNSAGQSETSSNRNKKGNNQRPQMTQEAQSKKRILALNLAEAERRSNSAIMAQLEKTSKDSKGISDTVDPDWQPDEEDSQDSIVDVIANGIKIRNARCDLMKKINLNSQLDANNGQDTSGNRSPSKEELKRQLAIANIKLQMAYDKSSDVKGTSASEKPYLKKTTHDTSAVPKPNTGMGLLFGHCENQDKWGTGNVLGDDASGSYDNPGMGIAEDVESAIFNVPDASSPREKLEQKKSSAHSKQEQKEDDQSSSAHDIAEHIESAIFNVSDASSPREKLEQKKSSAHSKQEQKEDQSSNAHDDSKLEASETSGILEVDDELQYQLYGPRDDTIELVKNSGIYCKKDVVAVALGNAHNINHVIRRLMHGVFIPSKILNCTKSGQTWRAGGKDRGQQEVKPLHQGALKAITKFANAYAKGRKWPKKPFESLTPIFSGRLNEMKKHFNTGILKD